MRSLEDYKQIAGSEINIGQFENDRIQKPVKELLRKDHVIDPHTHFFDSKCVNAAYLAIRFAKDILGIRSATEVEKKIEEYYKITSYYEDDWNEKFEAQLEGRESVRGGIKDILFKILRTNKMEQVYDHYIKDCSLATTYDLPKENVLTTVLMMDFKHAWNVKIGKSIYDQITELKELSSRVPVLPFLFCDPRRADDEADKENLYSLFNYAFSEPHPFFGVKIYPALGYDPSDFRMWPIYEICEKYHIPVLSHCGGESISTASLSLKVYEGEKEVVLKANKRPQMAYQLNDPKRWEIVLKRYPELKLNLAHFGGYDTWKNAGSDQQQRKETIFDLMKNYQNVYADFSYNIVDKKVSAAFISKVKEDPFLQERALFGSDYWVVFKEGSLAKKQKKFLNNFDRDIQEKLVKTNPEKYLFK